MSARNFFIINRIDINKPIGLDKISNELVNLAITENFGINFDVKNYHDSLLELLNVEHDYFCISDSFTYIETDTLFDIYDCYEAIKHMPKKEGKIKERELLYKKFTFLNKIIDMLFTQLTNIESIDFYLSDQYTTLLSDYSLIKVCDRNLTNAFINMMEPTKQENYFGFKTRKFRIK